MRYKPGNYQFTEGEMKRRVFKLLPKIFWRRGFDILVTHAPAYQLNDSRDLPHQGFKVFLKLIEKYKPKYFPSWPCRICPMENSINDMTNYQDTHVSQCL